MIDIHDLHKRHGDLDVLKGVSLAINRGEVAAVVGPSGGGKSTLLRCINGLEGFQRGHIRVGDVNLHADDAGKRDRATLLTLRRRVGMVFQQFNLFPHMNVLENVMSGPRFSLGRPYGEVEGEARDLLKRVGLSDKVKARPEELSGGQQQRVAIARALAMKPDAILFDEPTSALDPRMAAEVLAVISDLARSGQTMIVVTHAMGFARQAHTIHVMHEGFIVESGPPAEVLGDPKTAVTREFLHETVVSEHIVAASRGPRPSTDIRQIDP
jgi:ABC-type polar amino acid transport system ATPase subunit